MLRYNIFKNVGYILKYVGSIYFQLNSAFSKKLPFCFAVLIFLNCICVSVSVLIVKQIAMTVMNT